MEFATARSSLAAKLLATAKDPVHAAAKFFATATDPVHAAAKLLATAAGETTLVESKFSLQFSLSTSPVEKAWDAMLPWRAQNRYRRWPGVRP